jgi:aryl sulfotransferase
LHESWYDALNNNPGRVGPPIEKPPASVKQYYHDWLDQDGHPWWPFWDNINSWWAIRHLPNVHFVHFSNLKKDMPSKIRRIAKFLDIPIDESSWNSTESVPLGGAFWDGGAKTFINKGINGRWRDILADDESLKYEKMALEKLGSGCAQWLESGDMP